jgi:cell division protein FtsW
MGRGFKGESGMNRWSDRLIPHLIFCVTTCLVLFGLVMVYSSSAFDNYKSSRDKWETLVQTTVETATVKAGAATTTQEAIADLELLRKEDADRRASMWGTFLRQSRWVVLGFVILTLTAMLDYPVWSKKIGWLVLGFLLLQSMLFIVPADTGLPIQSRIVNGARSSIQFLVIRFQPSEVAKVGVTIFTAWFLARRFETGKKSLLSLLPAVLIIGTSVGLILCESDKGVAGHLMLAMIAFWMISGVRFLYILLLSGAGAAAMAALVAVSEEAKSRIFGVPFQLEHALAAFSRGGLFGRGLGDGDADLAYLYGAHTDFILAVVGEELGFVATLSLVLGYLFLILLGIRVASRCADPFGTYLALGVTVLLGTQAFLYMAVNTGLAPTTGFTLPLISYGGSSLIWTMAAIGILINISLTTPNQLLENAKRGTGPFGFSGRGA